MSKSMLLIESTPIRLSVEESTSGKLIARGEFGRCDVATQNGRVYPRKLIEREIKKLSESIGRRSSFGELDHPNDGKTKLSRASHVITGLKVNDDGVVIGEAEILNTPNGQILRALLEANCEIGVSSRGFGSTAPGDNGDVVGEDFSLRSYDFVADPAMKTAYPQIFSEDIDDEIDPVDMLRAEFPDVVKQLEESIKASVADNAHASVDEAIEAAKKEAKEEAREEFRELYEKRLVSEMVQLREDVEKDLRKELTEDPDVAASKAVLAQIYDLVGAYKGEASEDAVNDALKAKDLTIKKVEEQRDLAMAAAKDGAYKLVLERATAGHIMSETIKGLMAGHEKVCTEEEYKTKIDTIIEDLNSIPIAGNEPDDEYEIENRDLKLRVEGFEEKIEELSGKLKRAVDIGVKLDARAKIAEDELEAARQSLKEAELKAYKAESVVGLSNGDDVLGLMEDEGSEKGVDGIVQSKGVERVGNVELERLRSEYRKGVSSKKKELNESRVRRTEMDRFLGTSMEEYNSMAGVNINKG